MFQSHIERFSPCRGGPQVRCARPDLERQRPGLLVLRLTPGRWNPDLSMRRMMGRARGRRIGVRHFLPRMKWNLLRGGPFATHARTFASSPEIVIDKIPNMNNITDPSGRPTVPGHASGRCRCTARAPETVWQIHRCACSQKHQERQRTLHLYAGRYISARTCRRPRRSRPFHHMAEDF